MYFLLIFFLWFYNLFDCFHQFSDIRIDADVRDIVYGTNPGNFFALTFSDIIIWFDWDNNPTYKAICNKNEREDDFWKIYI